MRSSIVMILLLVSSPCHVLADENSIDDEAADLAYQGLADLTLLRDETMKRFTLMVRGERQIFFDETVKRDPLELTQLYWLQAANKSKDLHYTAYCKVMGPESSNRGYEYQRWSERYDCGNNHRARSGAASHRGYTTRPAGTSKRQFMAEMGQNFCRLHPFDDLVSHAMYMYNSTDNSGWIEKVYLQTSKLIAAKEITQGNILTTWRWKYHTLDYEIELTQSKAHDYLPIHVKYNSKIKDKPKYFGETKIKWKRHPSGNFLPFVVNATASGQFGLQLTQQNWVYDWRIGKEAPDDFFDCDSDDFRLNFTPLYDFEFDVYMRPGGLITGTKWTTPKELLEED